MNKDYEKATEGVLYQLRMAMQAEGVTMSELGVRTGRTVQNVSLFFQRKNVSINYVAEMLDALGYTMTLTVQKKEDVVPPEQLPPTCPYAKGGLLYPLSNKDNA